MTRRLFCAIALILAVAAPAVALDARAFVSVIRIIDGDTLVVWDGRAEQTLRLAGIDTPELRPNPKAQRDARAWGVPVEHITECGRKARRFLSSFSPPGTAVRVVQDSQGHDVYGRLLAHVHTQNGDCLNEILLRNGYALAPARYRHDRRQRYAEVEGEAKSKQRGFWKTLWRNEQ